jgi:hypothetical protein
MFELSTLRAAPLSVARPPSDAADSSIGALAGREFGFAAAGVPPVRFPRDRQSLANIWKLAIASVPPAAEELAALWTTLLNPCSRIPLTSAVGDGRRFALVGVIDSPYRTGVLTIVEVLFAPQASKWAPPAVAGVATRVATNVDKMAELLEDLYIRALPQAQSPAQKQAVRAMWLGGGDAAAASDPMWRDRIKAMGAVMGLNIEVVEEPARRTRNVVAALGQTAAPVYLFVWQPHSRGAERITDSFRQVCADGEVVLLDEPEPADAILEARLALVERGQADPPSGVPVGRTPPVVGEERFYIKTGGSKAGDLLIDVTDCGHNKWGGDVQRKSPRASMGVARLEGVRPKALFLCSKCNKHRWRARF